MHMMKDFAAELAVASGTVGGVDASVMLGKIPAWKVN